MKRVINVLSFVAVVSFALASLVYAHCDTLDGPVIQDAQIAIEKGDITPVLKWIKQENESEVRAAFDEALVNKKENKDTQEIEFFEVLVRVHRAGEGASFTGLKPAGEVEPIVAKADKALEQGSVDGLISMMTQHLTEGVRERFDRALERSKHKDESVEAGRKYVEAYVEYMHYMEGVHKAVMGQGGHQHEDIEEGEHETHHAK